MSNDVYGIDLGTTYSAVARINNLGLPEIVDNFEGEKTTPSVVHFEGETNVVVGSIAKRSQLADPDNTAFLVKRYMGTEHPMEFQGREYTPESISAIVLRELVRTANNETGEEVGSVVITVPAYFGVQAREATRQAGEIAGLTVVGIVTEPVAAALSVGLGREAEETVLVYDLGGGTFDTTVLRIAPGRVEVVTIDGNRKLGGADWDRELQGMVLRKFAEQTGVPVEEAREDEVFMIEILSQAEDAKKTLSRREQHSVRCRFGQHDEQVSVTRAEFEEVTRHLVSQTLEIAQRALAKAQTKEPGLTVDRVIVVGGSSRMPMIGAALRDQLGWDPMETEFDVAVAKGAAIYGQAAIDEILTTDEEAPAEVRPDAPAQAYLGGASQLQVNNVLSRGLGIHFVRDSGVDPWIKFIVHTNDSLPATPTPIPARTAFDNQTGVDIRLFEQDGEVESDVPGHNRELRSQTLPIPAMLKGAPIEITLTVDAEGTARVQAFDPAGGERIEFEVRVSLLSAKQVEVAAGHNAELTLRS